jgi:phosphoglycerate dehydrogenase-like enzyme
MKVVFGGHIVRAPVLEMLRQVPGIELVEADEVTDVIPHLAGADVLVISNPRAGQGAKVAQALNAPGRTVKWVQMVSAGTEGLTSYPLPADLPVTNHGGAAAPAVAEHAMALLLALGRRLDVALQYQARSEWGATAMRPLTRAIEGSRIGIVGMGNIGREFALRARPFGARLHGFSRSGSPNEAVHEMHRLSDLAEHVGSLDSIVVCVALVPQTRHLFDEALIARCRKGALLVNIARGEIVDIAALEAALRSGQLGGAATDVTDPIEPLPADATLWTAPNLLVTPHVAATGNRHVGVRTAAVVQDNLERFREGAPLRHLVER